MSLLLDISKDVLSQYEDRFGLAVDNTISLKPEDGNGTISTVDFPGDLSLYQFIFNLREPFSMSSYNPSDSDWYLLNVNLSEINVRKEVNGNMMDLQRYLPTGILFYTPGIRVKSQTLPNKSFEVALVRFHKRFLDQYFESLSGLLSNFRKAVIYEDLDPFSEVNLRTALSPKQSSINRHAGLLAFLGRFFEKLAQRDTGIRTRGIHPEDLKGLFQTAAILRNPVPENLPDIKSLAENAGMSPTKFKLIFRQVFGAPPIRYHQKIRMEYAKAELVTGKRSASEISYELGYSHPSKFSTAFKKQFGLLPSEI